MQKLLMLCFALGFAAVLGGERHLEWRADQPLTWDDFKASPDANSEMRAMTKSRISFKWSCSEEAEFSFDVLARFDRGDSWRRNEVTDDLLVHEQWHFNITELYARKLRKLMSELEEPCSLSAEELKGKAATVQQEWDKRQKLYDRETEHSADAEAQKRWQAMLAKEMKALEAYALK
jgi:hypothetical protein